MATWRPVGIITPVVDSWLWLEKLPSGNFFKLVCEGVLVNSRSFLQLQEWRASVAGPVKIIQPRREQVFTLGEPGNRLIAVRKAYPMKAVPDQQDYQIRLDEWVEDVTLDPKVGLWLPGKG